MFVKVLLLLLLLLLLTLIFILINGIQQKCTYVLKHRFCCVFLNTVWESSDSFYLLFYSILILLTALNLFKRSDLNISISHLNQEREKRVVFLSARVHPGESPASFICQGVIDFLVSQHPIAQVLRDHVIFKIVPMLNPDGVYLGNYRSAEMNNRDPSPWAHPTLHAVKQLIVQMNQDPKVSLEFYIDVHAHSTMMNGFMYGNVFEEEERGQRQAVFPRLLCQNAPDFSLSSTSFNRDVVKAGTGRRFLGGLYLTAGSTSPVPYTEDGCILSFLLHLIITIGTPLSLNFPPHEEHMAGVKTRFSRINAAAQ
uniref:AGBL carboxypeptidase 4 n=1 Tax=Sinocyclocheilus grahami TaxID=75366 RepID=A0A672PKJ1_SINGR